VSRGEEKRKERKERNILWFEPPFSGEIKTDIKRLLLNLLAKPFKKGTVLGNPFYKNNTKIS